MTLLRRCKVQPDSAWGLFSKYAWLPDHKNLYGSVVKLSFPNDQYQPEEGWYRVVAMDTLVIESYLLPYIEEQTHVTFTNPDVEEHD